MDLFCIGLRRISCAIASGANYGDRGKAEIDGWSTSPSSHPVEGCLGVKLAKRREVIGECGIEMRFEQS
jgi:hypothetical protein